MLYVTSSINMFEIKSLRTEEFSYTLVARLTRFLTFSNEIVSIDTNQNPLTHRTTNNNHCYKDHIQIDGFSTRPIRSPYPTKISACNPCSLEVASYGESSSHSSSCLTLIAAHLLGETIFEYYIPLRVQEVGLHQLIPV